MIKYKKHTSNIVTLTLDMEGRKVNIINHEIAKAFIPVLEHLEKEKEAGELAGVIITSAKPSFLAGGDLDYLYETNDAEDIFAFIEEQKDLFRSIELLKVPIVAAMNGSALGSGFELALACNHRILINDPKHVVGLPEVTLGLLPGAGGIIRLMWLLGMKKALDILTKGERYKPEDALAAGLVDELASDYNSMIDKAHAWIKANPEPVRPWDDSARKIPGGTPCDPKIAQLTAAATAQMTKKTRNNYPAPQAILNTLVEGSMLDFDTALRVESRYFTELLLGKTARNMTKAFWYDLNAIRAGKSRPKGIGKFRPRKIGIIGAGMMGSGIAYISAMSGLDVVLKDVSKPVAERGKGFSEELLKQKVAKGHISEANAKSVLDGIHPTEIASDFEGCDLIIEAVFENQSLKSNVTKEAEKYIDEYSIFASNTSTLPITGLAKASIRPENFIGLHFFSPVSKMKLVEIIVGEKTSDETLARAFDFVKMIRKFPIVVNDSRGFYTSRVFSTYVMEGAAMLQEGYPVAAIENAGLKAGMPTGPLAVSDEVALSLSLDINEQAKKDMGEAYEPHPAIAVFEKMVLELNRPGKAKGAGFYEYPEDAKKHLWQGLTELFPVSKPDFDFTEMMERLMFVQALETVRCLEEKVLHSVADANIGSIFGWGFAPFKGGTLQYINDYGVAEFVEKAKVLAAKFGERFEPPTLLMEMAEKGEVFE